MSDPSDYASEWTQDRVEDYDVHQAVSAMEQAESLTDAAIERNAEALCDALDALRRRVQMVGCVL